MAGRTREQMEAIIARGASVMLDHNVGQASVVSTVATLPTAAQLAKKSGDPARVAAARDLLLERKRALEAELATLPEDFATDVLDASDARFGGKSDDAIVLDAARKANADGAFDSPPAEKPKVEPLPLPEPKPKGK